MMGSFNILFNLIFMKSLGGRYLFSHMTYKKAEPYIICLTRSWILDSGFRKLRVQDLPKATQLMSDRTENKMGLSDF